MTSRTVCGLSPAGIYVHVPFCRARCSYCAFYTVTDRFENREAFLATLGREIRTVAENGWVASGLRLPPQGGREVDTIYLGGGTPSLLAPDHLGDVLRCIRSCFTVSGDAEITLEANPETVTRTAAAGWLRTGINRVSLGVQTFDGPILRSLGRRHGKEIIVAAVRRLRRAGLENLNLDLIAGVGQERLQSDLRAALDLKPEHLSLYLLELDTEEVGGTTALALQTAAGRFKAPEPDWYADTYPTAVQWLQERGWQRYEICNFARPGFQCRHNLKYWRGEEVLGFGPAAHSLVGGCRFAVQADMDAYLESGRRRRRPQLQVDNDKPIDRAAERLILGLRLDQGLDLAALSVDQQEILRQKQQEIREHEIAGLLWRRDGRLKLTSRGILLSNEVFRSLLP